MHKNEERIVLPETQHSRLPLGLKKIHTTLIPSEETEQQFIRYNRKYAQLVFRSMLPGKPISKILQ